MPDPSLPIRSAMVSNKTGVKFSKSFLPPSPSLCNILPESHPPFLHLSKRLTAFVFHPPVLSRIAPQHGPTFVTKDESAVDLLHHPTACILQGTSFLLFMFTCVHQAQWNCLSALESSSRFRSSLPATSFPVLSRTGFPSVAL